MQAKSQEKFPDSEIEWAVDTSPQGLEGDGWELWSWLPGEVKGMELRAARLGRVPGGGSHTAQALGTCVGSSQQGGHQDHPGYQPQLSSRSGVAQPTQPRRWALGEAASAQLSQHRCYCHPSTLGALSQPWVVVGERKPTPTCVPWDYHPIQLEGDISAESHSHSQPFPHCQDIFAGAG